MHARRWYLLVMAGLLVSQVLSAQAKSAVVVPQGTTVSPMKFSDEQPAINLEPAEQVAFLFVNGIWGLEGRSLEKESGLERLCTLRELISGVKMPGGEILGLSVNPVKDTNYNYDVLIIGEDCLIRALPRVKGLGSFAMLGSPRRVFGTFYYNPDGPDLTKAVKVTEMGYGGDGFVR
jgi:hypothetical protein